MPETGEYLLTNVGFSKTEKPLLVLQRNGNFSELLPLGHHLTLRFDITQRCCVGWRDIASSERHPCPDKLAVDAKYEQCAACQQRTGFNPAFYHAATVSTQQETRNLEPHLLYLAYFDAGTIKVGISHAARNNSRLLEQGARSALILDIFPTAHIARHYESKIAALPGIAETVQLRKKISGLSFPYNQTAAANTLKEIRHNIERQLAITFSLNDVQHFDSVFFPSGTPILAEVIDTADQHIISGKIIGMLGSLLFYEQKDVTLFLPIKKYVGYSVVVSREEVTINLPARQTSLF